MKRRYLAVLMGVMVAATSVPAVAYAENTQTETTQENTDADSTAEDAKTEDAKGAEDQDENTIWGEVKSVSDTEITIAVGTKKEMGQPGGDGQQGGQNGEAPEKPDGNGQQADAQDSASQSQEDAQDGETAENDSSAADEQSGEAPEKPEGDDQQGGDQNGGAPEMPDGGNGGEAPSMLDLTGEEQTITVTENTVITKQQGGAPQGQSGGDQSGAALEMPGGDGQSADSEEISLSDIQEGDIVAITLDEDGNAATITVQSADMGGGQGGPGGQSQGVDSYTAVNEYTEDTTVSNETLTSTGTDENAALISSGANVTLDDVAVARESNSSTGGDNSSFYGVGAAVLATDGTAYVKNGSVTTDAAGGAGLFAYGDGTVYASGTTIKTQQDTSGGVHVAGGGTLYGWDLNVETNGESSAAIRSDRGGGTMRIDGGTYVSNGVGSPAIYSTADVAASNAALTANGSEAVCIEGLNSIHLYNCDLTGNMSDLDQNDNTWTVILYQSMSGDSEVGNSTFQMDGGSLTSENGGVFYTTNTESTITLNNVDINYNDDNEFFLQCTGNTNQRGWGQSGANGADCHFTGISQAMQGDVIWDSISDLDFYLTEGSSLTGAIVDDESYAGEGGSGYCNVYVSADSTWTVTGDSTVSSLENEGTIVDSEGKTVTIQGTDGTVYVEGDSDYTITTGSYSDTVDLSGATAIDDQSNYQVEKPSEL